MRRPALVAAAVSVAAAVGCGATPGVPEDTTTTPTTTTMELDAFVVSMAPIEVEAMTAATSGERDARTVELGLTSAPLFKMKPNVGIAPWCSGTLLDANTLITAAHCIDGGSTFYLAGAEGSAGGFAEYPFATERRACAGRSGRQRWDCAQHDSGPDVLNDFGVVYLPSGSHSFPVRDGRVALRHFDGERFPQMILLGYRGADAPLERRVVCNAWVDNSGTPSASRLGNEERPVHGDSGGALVAIDASGTAVIVGVVSAIEEQQDKWLFAPVPKANSMPRPSAATDWNWAVESFDDTSGFARFVQCTR